MRPRGTALRLGLWWLAFQFLLLPGLLTAGNGLLPTPLSMGKLNFLYYAFNFTAVLLILRAHLADCLRALLARPSRTLCWAGLAFLGQSLCAWLLSALFGLLLPGFGNRNDQAVAQAFAADGPWMLAGTVLLVPLTEEALFRGVLLQGLGDRPRLAWLTSVVGFALVHILGHLGSADALTLALSFLQYLPAGVLLGLACKNGGLFAAVIAHTAVNLLAVAELLAK